jgi:nitrate reductase beta subunit
MEVRSHVAMVFHLDKCIGCHTCSVACKNIWTDRPGAEYMWWNNVETKPGTGYPTRWEDQLNFNGGWEVTADRRLRLKSQSRMGALFKLFYNPNQPTLDDYYEPWTYEYENLFHAPASDDQPTAKPISLVTGELINIEAGPNWDDDLSGSTVYAANDPNLAGLTEDEKQMMFNVEGLAMMHLPRICNHCVNPSCVASCPSGAIYKRGEDGIVLIDQDRCRGWRACVAACPYKKTYYNWQTGKSEKCILCYPRLETGQPPACFHSCVGRIRYMGVLLYDASLVAEAMSAPEASLVEAQRKVILNPHDPAVVKAALEGGMSIEMIEAAQKSPIYKWVIEWQMALPLHPEFRTMPMLFYVPPLLPVMGRSTSDVYQHTTEGLFSSMAKARMPMKYLANLFSAGNVGPVEESMRKLFAVRMQQRSEHIGDVDADEAARALREAHLTVAQAKEIYRLTTLCTVNDRFVLPPVQREEAIESLGAPEACKGGCGLGMTEGMRRGA